MNKYTKEQYATGKYDVLYSGLYPRRIGHIVGANRTYQAERGPVNLGYFKTLKAAMQAIITEYERPYTDADVADQAAKDKASFSQYPDSQF